MSVVMNMGMHPWLLWMMSLGILLFTGIMAFVMRRWIGTRETSQAALDIYESLTKRPQDWDIRVYHASHVPSGLRLDLVFMSPLAVEEPFTYPFRWHERRMLRQAIKVAKAKHIEMSLTTHVTLNAEQRKTFAEFPTS